MSYEPGALIAYFIMVFPTTSCALLFAKLPYYVHPHCLLAFDEFSIEEFNQDVSLSRMKRVLPEFARASSLVARVGLGPQYQHAASF